MTSLPGSANDSDWSDCAKEDYDAQSAAPLITSDGHHLSRRQIAKHGRDRYPTREKQLKKLAEELTELALALGHAPAIGGADPEVRREYADAGLALHALGDKLGLDLIECMRELVENDARDFRVTTAAPNRQD